MTTPSGGKKGAFVPYGSKAPDQAETGAALKGAAQRALAKKDSEKSKGKKKFKTPS